MKSSPKQWWHGKETLCGLYVDKWSHPFSANASISQFILEIRCLREVCDTPQVVPVSQIFRSGIMKIAQVIVVHKVLSF